MTSHPVVPTVLGPEAEALLRRDVDRMSALLRRLSGEDWHRPTPVGGGAVLHVAAHLAQGAARLGREWETRVAAAHPEALHEPFDEPGSPPALEEEPGGPAQVLTAYGEATDRLLHALGTALQQHWSWPVWSPVGGVETLAEAVRRTLAHHYVHRHDILAALGGEPDPHEDTVRLVVEFVLDALARRGGDAITPPISFEVVTSLPGAGTWELIFEAARPPRHVDSVWDEIVGHHPESRRLHRVERGSDDASRAGLYGSGDTVWRAAFGRGARWEDLEVHGDDEARGMWHALIRRVAARTGRAEAIGRIQA